jgi:hypothetical protein
MLARSLSKTNTIRYFVFASPAHLTRKRHFTRTEASKQSIKARKTAEQSSNNQVWKQQSKTQRQMEKDKIQRG